MQRSVFPHPQGVKTEKKEKINPARTRHSRQRQTLRRDGMVWFYSLDRGSHDRHTGTHRARRGVRRRQILRQFLAHQANNVTSLNRLVP